MSSTKTELTGLVQLNAEVGRIDGLITLERNQLAELATNRTALESRLSSIQSRQPAEDVDLDDPLAQALAANPGAELASADVAQVAERSAKRQSDVRAWRKEVSLVERAITIVDGNVVAGKERLAELDAARAAAKIRFFRAAHPYLLAVFRERLDALHEEVLAPLLGMEQMEDGNGTVVISRTGARLFDRTEIMITTGWGNDERVECLSPRKQNRHARAPNCQDDAERFRLSLGGSGAP
jgi:hypothetical protein